MKLPPACQKNIPRFLTSSRRSADRTSASEAEDRWCESSREQGLTTTNARCPENKRKKPFKLNFDVVSEKHSCTKCGKAIKQRLVNQKKTAPKLCYKCWLEAKGKTKAQRRE